MYEELCKVTGLALLEHILMAKIESKKVNRLNNYRSRQVP